MAYRKLLQLVVICVNRRNFANLLIVIYRDYLQYKVSDCIIVRQKMRQMQAALNPFKALLLTLVD